VIVLAAPFSKSVSGSDFLANESPHFIHARHLPRESEEHHEGSALQPFEARFGVAPRSFSGYLTIDSWSYAFFLDAARGSERQTGVDSLEESALAFDFGGTEWALSQRE
jgi:hypothetical protein